MSSCVRRVMMLIVLVITGSMVTSTAYAQVDYSGTWNLETQTFLPDSNDPCVYSGTAEITQNGDVLVGTASLTLTSGPGACPSEMTAEVNGRVEGGDIQMGLLLGGQLGEATFYTQGVLASSVQSVTNAGEKVMNGDMSLEGGFDVTAGQFTGQTGSWSAIMAAMMIDERPIPTLAFYGLLALVLVFVTVGGISLRRRQLPG